jgi:hypothetical protein
MASSSVYQIYYDEPTRRERDPGFLPLDNSDNLRPDWREYWPIRRWLQTQAMDEGRYYGFLSPKFGAKTGLTAARVHEFVEQRARGADVVIFSPYFDCNAGFFNVFEQAQFSLAHAGLISAAQTFVTAAGLDLDLDEWVTDVSNTVFCNYFVALPAFWRRWLRLNEVLFHWCEDVGNGIGRLYNVPTIHDEGRWIDIPLRVFLMERTASLLLATDPNLSAAIYDPLLLPMHKEASRRYEAQLLSCDALKQAYKRTRNPHYRQAFDRVRMEFLQRAGFVRKGRFHHLAVGKADDR